MQPVRQDASEPEDVKAEALKPEMTCVINHQVVKIHIEDAQCCNLTSVLAIENQLKRNTEDFDCPCEDENRLVQPAVNTNLQQQPPVTDGQELESKPEQKPKQQKRKSREKRKEQKKGKKQVTIGERMDGGNAKKRRKTVVKSTRQSGKEIYSVQKYITETETVTEGQETREKIKATGKYGIESVEVHAYGDR